GSGMGLIQLGPEQTEQDVTTSPAVAAFDLEVGQQRESLGLPQDGGKLAAFGGAEANSADGAELQHERGVKVIGGRMSRVTAGSRVLARVRTYRPSQSLAIRRSSWART